MTSADTRRRPFAVFDLHDTFEVARHALSDPNPSNHVLAVLPGPVLSMTCPNPSATGTDAVPGHSPIAERALELTEPVVLSLTHLPDPTRSVMATLYRGLVLGHNWLAVTANPGGGLDIDTLSNLPAHLAPANAARIPATVDLDTLGPFASEIVKGYGWNGWAVPTFDLTTVRAIGQALAGQATYPDQVTIVQIGDDTTMTLIEQAGTEEEQRTVVQSDTHGRYGLGAWSWCWSIDTTPTLPDLGPPDLRLWFPWRLARAVAAHALACLDHDTIGYAGGGSSGGPGLSLTIKRGSATVTSTGRPGPKDSFGSGFAIGDRRLRFLGRPVPDHGEHTVHVPVTDLSAHPSRSVDRCAAWLVLDVRFDLPGMAGVAHVVAQQAHQRDDLDPTTVTWRETLVSCEQFGGVYRGQVAQEARAGLAGLIARFDRDTIGQMVAATALDEGRPGAVWVHAIGDSVQLLRTAASEPGVGMLQMGWAPRDADGMYILGAHQLAWHEVPPPAEPTNA